MANTPITIETVGDLADHGYALSAYCRACGRHSAVDLLLLAARVGRDRRYVGGLPLRCAVCDGRDVAITVLAPGSWP